MGVLYWRVDNVMLSYNPSHVLSRWLKFLLLFQKGYDGYCIVESLYHALYTY